MDRKPDIQYVHQFYIYGSEATAPELKPVPKKKRQKLVLPVPKIEKNINIYFDIASVCGIAVACVMMILMTVGIYQLSAVQQEYNRMESYVISLQNENLALDRTYHAGFDADDVYEKATALGMIPVEQARTVSIRADIPQPEPAPTLWENICWFFSQWFA
ncbi:MAG: hypothetical protein J6B95_01670 [Oscillospiraceae bacterium]|nr:hypothetical protein [Oscillospiraceae bacterium]